MPFIATDDGVKLYYEDQGQGKPVVLVHGWSGSRIHFGFQVPALSSKFRVITYDHRGHGVSDRPEYGLTMSRFAWDLEQLLAYLDLQEVTLVGWSMGAHVLFEYVNQFGCGRLAKAVIVDMTPKLVNEGNWSMGLYHGQFTHQDNLNALTTMCGDWEQYAEEFMRKVAPDMGPAEFKLAMKGAMTNTPHVMCAMWIAMTKADYRQSLGKITIPTLVVYGDKSTLYSPETASYMGENIPEAEVVRFEGCTHMLVLEKPDLFNEVIENFVNG